MELHIYQHRGIGPVSFGMTPVEVRREMGHAPRAKGRRMNCYFGSSFQVSFGEDGVEFVKVSSSCEETVLFDAVDVFDVPADQLLTAISRHDTADPVLSRPPNQYGFPEPILTLGGGHHSTTIGADAPGRCLLPSDSGRQDTWRLSAQSNVNRGLDGVMAPHAEGVEGIGHTVNE